MTVSNPLPFRAFNMNSSFLNLKFIIPWLILQLAVMKPLLLCHSETENVVKEPSLQELYDLHSCDYEALIYRTHYQGPSWVMKKKHFLTYSHTILDLGCADGHIGRLLLNFHPTYRLTGVDFSSGMVKACTRKGGYQEVIQADLNHGIPQLVEGKTYDAVFAIGCLEFIEHHERLFQQIHALLPSNGQFWLTLQANPHGTEGEDKDVVTTYSEQEAIDLLNKHGFKIVDIEFQQAGYIRSFDKKEIPYLFIIAEAI